MKNVAILVPENSVMQAIADPQYCFNAVNQFLAVSGKKPLFNVELVGLKKEIFINEGKFSIHTYALLKDLKNKYPLYQFKLANSSLSSSIDEKFQQIEWILYCFSSLYSPSH